MISPIGHLGRGVKTVRRRAVGPNSKKLPAESRVATVTRANLDYANLQDETLEDDNELKQDGSVRVSMTILVMLETLCESVWAYAVSTKGYMSDLWLPGEIANDLTTA